MAFNAFLTFTETDLKGESQDPNHPNAIDIKAFHFEFDNPTALGTGGAFKPGLFKFMKATDRTSPMFMLRTAKGTQLKQATLALRKPGNAKADYIVYTMTNVTVASHETSGSAGDDAPSETIQLGFTQLEIRHTMISATGDIGTITDVVWNSNTGGGQ